MLDEVLFETACATLLGAALVSSPEFTVLEAGRDGRKGCLALIWCDGVDVVVVLVSESRASGRRINSVIE